MGTVVLFALIRHWTAVLAPAVVLSAPFIGAGTGLYPAIRASLIEPLVALRR